MRNSELADPRTSAHIDVSSVAHQILQIDHVYEFLEHAYIWCITFFCFCVRGKVLTSVSVVVQHDGRARAHDIYFSFKDGVFSFMLIIINHQNHA